MESEEDGAHSVGEKTSEEKEFALVMDHSSCTENEDAADSSTLTKHTGPVEGETGELMENASKLCLTLDTKEPENDETSAEVGQTSLLRPDIGSSLETPEKCVDAASKMENKGLPKTLKKKSLKGTKQSPSKSQKDVSQKAVRTPRKRRADSDENLSDTDDAGTSKRRRVSSPKEGQLVETDEGEWEDIDESDINEILEEKAERLKMTAKNVKSLLRYVLTHDQVLKMLQNIQAEEGEKSPEKTASPVKTSSLDKSNSSLKLTRAKFKDILEKRKVLTPTKSAKEGPSIMDLEFAEEEDDEEYSPDKDDEANYSDDDESIVSSQWSEFGSPFPATPTTPMVPQLSSQVASGSGTPVSTAPVSCTASSSTSKNLMEAFSSCAEPTTLESSEQRTDTIAFRTRSRLPLTSTSITDIESAFVAPDITSDLYDTHCDDAEWVQFLSSLYKTADDPDADDDANDPEFNYIAEAEREQPDREDFRFDKPARISKKELGSLINELQDLFEDEVLPYQAMAESVPLSAQDMPGPTGLPLQDAPDFTAPPVQNTGTGVVMCTFVEPGFKVPQNPSELNTNQSSLNPEKTAEDWSTRSEEPLTTSQSEGSLVTPDQQALIEDNMRKHIQLLAQSFLLSHGKSDSLAKASEFLLRELENFRRISLVGVSSAFNACNLDPALDVLTMTQELNLQETDYTFPSGSSVYLREELKWVLYKSPAFVYPNLLPALKAVRKPPKKYNKFLPSEDNLIALGLEEFKYCRNVSPVELIAEFLIRCKTANQIQWHVQFLASPKGGNNPVKHVKKTGTLPPDFPKPTLDPWYNQAPSDQSPDSLPAWCRRMKETEKSKLPKSIQSLCKPAQYQGQGSQVKNRPSWVGDTSQSKLDSRNIAPRSIIAQPQIPVQILPAKMPPISGIYIQFGQPVGNTPPLCAPALTNEPTVDTSVAVASANSIPWSELSPINTKCGGRDNTTFAEGNSVDLTSHVPEPSTPDLLTKTMLACGIEESPISRDPKSISHRPPGLSPAMVPYSSSTPASAVDINLHGRKSSVRNLQSEFDVAAPQTDVVLSPSSKTDEVIQSVNMSPRKLQHPHSPEQMDTDIDESDSRSQAINNNLGYIVSGGRSSSNIENNYMSRNEESTKKSENENDLQKEIVMDKDSYVHPTKVPEHAPLETATLDCSNVPSSPMHDSSHGANATTVAKECEKNVTILNAGNCGEEGGEKTVQNNSVTLDVRSRNEGPEIMNKLITHKEVETCVNKLTLKTPSENVANSDSVTLSGVLDSPNVNREAGVEHVDMDETSCAETIHWPDFNAAGKSSEMCGPDISVNSRNISESLKTVGSSNEKCALATAEQSVIESTPVIIVQGPQSLTTEASKFSTKNTIVISSSSSPQGETSSSSMFLVSAIHHSPVSAFPSNMSPEKTRSIQKRQKHLVQTTPKKCHPLAPKEVSPSQRSTPPYIALPKTSPKRKELNRQVRHILPKSFTFEIKSPSPTKATAMVLKRKATMMYQHKSPVKILAKPESDSPVRSRARSLFASPKSTKAQRVRTKTSGGKRELKSDPKANDPKRPDAGERVDENTVTIEGGHEIPPQVVPEEDGFLGDGEDQTQLDDLMAACTTIRYHPKKVENQETDVKSKAQKKKDVCLAMLEPDIMETDPKKDDRDTAYAQHYFIRVKEALQDEPERFHKFLTLLRDVNKDHSSPIELYADMVVLLAGHQDLVDDFAGFLLSFQAVICGCFVPHFEYSQIREILRKLEIYCGTSPFTFQRTLKMMSRWLSLTQEDPTDESLKEKLCTILRQVPGLMDNLLSYFIDETIPHSLPEDFEDVDLELVLATGVAEDKFEEVTLPEERERYNTKLCPCFCHTEGRDKKIRRKFKHCFSCSLQIFDGTPVCKTSRAEFWPLSVIYPEEEREKLARAKREAAQIALAKARAQKKLKKRDVKKMKKNAAKKMRGNLRKRRSRKSCDSGIKTQAALKTETHVVKTGANVELKAEGNENVSGSILRGDHSQAQSEKSVAAVLSADVGLSDELLTSQRAQSSNKRHIRTAVTTHDMSHRQQVPLPPLTDSRVELVTAPRTVAPCVPTTLSYPSVTAAVTATEMKLTGQPTQMTPVSQNSEILNILSRKLDMSSAGPVTSSSPTMLLGSKNPMLSCSLSPSSFCNRFPSPVASPAMRASMPGIQSSPTLIPPVTVDARDPVTVSTNSENVLHVGSDKEPETESLKTGKTKYVSANIKSGSTVANVSTPASAATSSNSLPDSLLNTQKVSITSAISSFTCQTTTTLSSKSITSVIHPSIELPTDTSVPMKNSNSQVLQSHGSLKESGVTHCGPKEDNVRSASSFSLLKECLAKSAALCSPNRADPKSLQTLTGSLIETFTLGGLDESLDTNLTQQLIQVISPSKGLGESLSKFDLLALIESSNLSFKDPATLLGQASSHNKISSENTTNSGASVSFAGVLSKNLESQKVPSPSESDVVDQPKPVESCDGLESMHNVESREKCQIPDQVKLQEDVSEGNPGNQSSRTPSIAVDQPDVESWTEEWDVAIMNVVAEEGVTQAAVEKIQRQIPEKSLQELRSRAELLLQWVQSHADSETSDSISEDSSW